MKLKVFILMLIINIGIGISASAAVSYDLTGGIPDAWNVFESEATVEKGMIISCTGEESTMSMASVTTDAMDMTGDVTFSFDMKINNDGGKSARELYLNNEVVLFSITGTSITVLDVGNVDIAADENFTLDISYTQATNDVLVWLNGENVISQTSSMLAGKLTSASYMSFSSYIIMQTAQSEWQTSRIDIYNGNNLNIVSFPERNGDILDIANTSEVYVDFGVVTNYGLKNGGSVALYNGESEVEATVVRTGAKVSLILMDGFSNGAGYKLVLKDGKTVFDEALDSIELEFMIPQEGYEAPEITITAPHNNKRAILGESVIISAEVIQGSEEIEKVELIVDGNSFLTVAEKPYEFKCQGLDLGEHSIYVKATDKMGLEKNSVEITVIVEENVPPTVSIKGIYEGNEVLIGQNVVIDATDYNDNLENVELMIDGSPMKKVSQFEFAYPDNLASGKHTLKAVAYDSLGKYAVSEVTAYFIKADSTLMLNQTMEKYDSEKSAATFPAGMYGNLDHGYVYSSERAGINAMIMEIPNAKKGKSMYSGISWVGTTEMPKEQFSVEMGVYFDDLKTQFGSILRSNENTVRFSEKDFIFKEGFLYIYDGGVEVQKISYQEDTWYSLKMIINLTAGTYSLYFDGDLVADNYKLAVAVPNVSLIRFKFQSNTDSAVTMGIAPFKVENITSYPYLNEVSFDDGGDVMSLNTVSFTAKMNVEAGSNFVIQDAVLYGDGIEMALKNFSYDQESSSVTAEMAQMPEAGCEYELLVNGKYRGHDMSTVVKFKAATGSFDAKNSGFTTVDGKVSFWADMENSTDAVKDAMLVIIKYEDGIMTEIESASAQIPSAGKRIITPTVTNDGKNVEIIVVIWDGWSSRKPINNKIYSY